jgi:uncharacterized protein with FMN-binding domain
MKFSTRYSMMTLSVAAVSVAAAFGPARAVGSFATHPAEGTPGQVSDGKATVVPIAAACHFHDGAFAGQVFDAYYGEVQVQANVSGGCVTSIDVLQYPADRRTSRRINDQALPILQSEVIRAQSGKVDIVTGATLTSRAYIRSLKDALDKAGL